MTNAIRDDNHDTVALGVSSADSSVTLPFEIDQATGRLKTTSAGGSGDVVGPASSTDNAVVRFDGTTGKLIQNSAVIIADTTGNISGPQQITLSGTTSGTLVLKPAAISGTNTVTFPAGTTDFSSTGGTSNVLRQSSAGAAITVGQLAASDLSNGTTGTGAVVLANSPSFTDDITLGAAAGATGSVIFKGTTSGTVTLTVADAAGTYTLKLPTTDGDANQFLQTDGAGNTTWASGGTGDVTAASNLTDNAIVRGDGGAKGVQTSGVVIDDSNNVTGMGTLASAAHTITSTSPTALAVGANGTTNPVLTVAASAASVATGISITGAAAASRAAIAVTSSGTDEGLSVDAKGAGTIRFGASSTGAVEFSRNAVPTANDGAALGTTALGFSDLHLATGGVINWANGEITLTETDANTLTFAGGVFALPSSGFSINGTTVTSTGTQLNYINAATGTTGTTSTNIVFSTSPTLVTPNIGVATATSINGLTITSSTGTLTITNGKTVSVSNTLTFAGTDSTTMTFPSTSQTIVGLTASQTLTNKEIQHTVEPSSDDTFTGETISGLNAGATIAQWEAVYLGSSSKWLLTDADAVGTAGSVMVGLAITSGTDTNPLTVLKRGVVRNDGWAWVTVGAPLYLSTTAGALTETAPSGTDDVVRVVGYVLSDDCIWFEASNDWITRV